MKLAIYTRDEGGLIEFRGVETWDSVEQMLQACCRDDETPEPSDMLGWGDDQVTWYGDTGVAIRNSNKRSA